MRRETQELESGRGLSMRTSMKKSNLIKEEDKEEAFAWT